jgi:hypothetical protein
MTLPWKFVLAITVAALVGFFAARSDFLSEPRIPKYAIAAPTPTPSATPTPSETPGGTPVMLDWSLLTTATDNSVIANLNPTPTPTPSPTPTFTPNQELLRYAEEVKRNRPWLVPDSTDWAGSPPGVSPATTILWSTAEPVVMKEGDVWKVTFKP